jgi:hypothetical protein
MIGQVGLLVQHANFAMLLAIKPINQAQVLASSLAGLPRAPAHAAVHAKQPCHTAKLTAPRRLSGDLIRYASKPTIVVS